MERGTYVAASAGMLQFRKLDVVNNNLANVNTPGFKRQMLVGEVQTFEETLASTVAQGDPYARGDHQRTPGTVNVRTATDFSPGPIKNTASPLDLALRNPNDFFVINTPSGLQYTRAGNFTLSEAGEIVTVDGFQLQGDGGAIAANGAGLTVTPDGSVKIGQEIVGKIQVVRLDNPEALERIGATRFQLKSGQGEPEQVEAELIPKALEMSNVSSISSMVDLITASKAFDMYTRSAQTIDSLNQIAISQVGRGR